MTLSAESCRAAASAMDKAIPRLLQRGYHELAVNMVRRRAQLLRRASDIEAAA